MRRQVLNSPKIRELRKRSRKALYWKTFFYFVFIGLFFAGLGFLSRASALQIEQVRVSGVQSVDGGELQKMIKSELEGNYFFIFSKRNALIYPKRKIKENSLKNFGRIGRIEVALAGFNTLQIEVEERQAKYLWCTDSDECYFVDEAGDVFDKAPTFAGPIFFKFRGAGSLEDARPNDRSVGRVSAPVGRQLLPEPEFRRLNEFKESLEKMAPLFGADQATVKENGEYELILSGGAKILFKKENDFEKILDNLNLAIAAEPLNTELKQKYSSLEHIDLRFDNKVYYKFK